MRVELNEAAAAELRDVARVVGSGPFDAEENRGLIALFGAVTAIAGLILIRHPTHALTAIALLVGPWLLVAGLLRLIRAFSQRGGRGAASALAVAAWALRSVGRAVSRDDAGAAASGS